MGSHPAYAARLAKLLLLRQPGLKEFLECLDVVDLAFDVNFRLPLPFFLRNQNHIKWKLLAAELFSEITIDLRFFAAVRLGGRIVIDLARHLELSVERDALVLLH